MAKSKKTVHTLRKAHVASSRLERLVTRRWFIKAYPIAALVILFGTTIFWSLFSARVHSGNADQLVNPYLFDTSSIMHGAMLPGQHTFLLKWPAFFLNKLFNESAGSFEVMTVVLSLLTVGGLAYIIHRIDPRPYVKGTLFLALASVLIVIPAQPYPGGLLPVNMAMIATRNIEYILYIASCWAIIRAKSLKDTSSILGCAGFILLIASDKLFLSLSLGAALTACIVYVLRHKWMLANFAARWLMTLIAASIGSLILLALINASGITNIVGQGNAPYKFVSSVPQFIKGLISAVLGLFTNFGANPAANTIQLRNIPRDSVHTLFSLAGPIIIINAMLLIGGLAASFQLLGKSLKPASARAKKKYDLSNAQKLSVMLLWTSLVAYGAFVITDHYYPVDARYLAIGMFALFITMTTYVRSRQWLAARLVVIGCIFVAAIGLSIPSIVRTYSQERAASVTANSRNNLIAQALKSHKVDLLVGDYWRVLPIKQLSQSNVTVMPLSDCTTPRTVLSSSAWQPDLQRTSFAYVLSLDKSQTDYPKCDINDIYTTYGRPNASVVIAGTIEKPLELVLFYDHGAHKSSPNNGKTSPVSPTVEAIPIQDLPSSVCSVPTSLNIVAHQDDDLLFMNPDIQRDIAAGRCVRTVYVTAGDAGANEYFWLGRERGSESAYSKMIGNDAIWIQRIVKIGDNQFITVANPQGNSKISIIFMRLPDGNIRGQGFNASRHESLHKLLYSEIPNVRAIYGNSSYSAASLTQALQTLMHFYQPAEIRTQSTYQSSEYPDHSDHMAVSGFTEKAHAAYQFAQFNNNVVIPLKHYVGYPVHSMPENVAGADLDAKTAAFLTYAKHDGTVCQTLEQCVINPAYGAYLPRQYPL